MVVILLKKHGSLWQSFCESVHVLNFPNVATVLKIAFPDMTKNIYLENLPNIDKI